MMRIIFLLNCKLNDITNENILFYTYDQRKPHGIIFKNLYNYFVLQQLKTLVGHKTGLVRAAFG